ncbi:MAG: flp pilus-assembly TadE/G-like family protein, partial [Catenulispora sp.]|nr:flp pilus-assembly TadE/G-like family protein [Catenulispora sp.]
MSPDHHQAGDTGSATVYAALLAGLLTTVTAAVLALGAAILARHRAATAADLAAISAASHTDTGQPPCEWATRVATANNARLLSCSCDGAVCLVRAAIPTAWGAATVTSRAGPADALAMREPEAAGLIPGALLGCAINPAIRPIRATMPTDARTTPRPEAARLSPTG